MIAMIIITDYIIFILFKLFTTCNQFTIYRHCGVLITYRLYSRFRFSSTKKFEKLHDDAAKLLHKHPYLYQVLYHKNNT